MNIKSPVLAYCYTRFRCLGWEADTYGHSGRYVLVPRVKRFRQSDHYPPILLSN